MRQSTAARERLADGISCQVCPSAAGPPYYDDSPHASVTGLTLHALCN
ncbi:hypothetical protein [Streptomyces sp. SAS_270]